MMRSILPLFGRSPFSALQRHMEKVEETLERLEPFFAAFLEGDSARTREIRKEILKREHEADKIKNEIRDHLPKSYFLPVDRRDLLSLLHQQDRLADLCEDIVIVATLREDLSLPPDLREHVREVLGRTRQASHTARRIISQLDELLEASFGGPEADAVLELIHQVGLEEHEVDKAIYTLAKELYRREEELGAVRLMLWQKLLELIGQIANAAESIGDQVRLMLSR